MRWRRSRKSASEPGGDAAEVEAPGWDAIDEAMAGLYGAAVPRHVGYVLPAALSTNLQGCSAYGADGHWHYVTYGLSELYTPDPDDDPDVSGWGFEFTMRIPRGSEQNAPGWPFTMLNELGKHVNGQGVPVQPGDRFDLRAPVTGHPHVRDAPPTSLTVYAFIVDPQLGVIRTPNGQVTFLQAVGITAAEKERMLVTSTAEVLKELSATNSLLLTDPARSEQVS